MPEKFDKVIWLFNKNWDDTMLERKSYEFLQVHVFLVVI
jgi:hypothetical protein